LSYSDRQINDITNKEQRAEDLLYGRRGEQQNAPVAVELMKECAEKEHPMAMYFIGVWHLYPVSGVHKDEQQAHRLLRKSANMGCLLARVMCLQRGIGEPADTGAAFALLTTADQSAPIVQNELGWCFADGVGVAKDLKRAAQAFQLAASQGFAAAQNNLGALYYDGLGVPKDPVQSARWFTRAAEQGHASAQCSLGSCYYDGYGVERDGRRAIFWYRKAADQGVAVGQYCLGTRFALTVFRAAFLLFRCVLFACGRHVL
jgi:TPR repeat protein